MFLSFHRLVQTVAPTATFHDTSCLLVNYFYFTVDYHILVIAIEHGIRFQKLLYRMHALTLYGVISEEFVFLVELVFLAQTIVGLKS